MSILVTAACFVPLLCVFFFQAEDGIRDLVRSRGLGDVYKRQPENPNSFLESAPGADHLCYKVTVEVAGIQHTVETLSLIHI